MGTAQRVFNVLAEWLDRRLEGRKRIVSGVVASLLVLTVVLLALDGIVPFPRPGEQPLYDSRGWSLMVRPPAPQDLAGSTSGPATSDAVGGSSSTAPPLSLMSWVVQPGDTIIGIAERLGMNPDTVSSLNRSNGRGVHNVVVGERILVPNQDGIKLAVRGNLDELCRQHDLDPSEVLAVNGRTRRDLAGTVILFFPGVQHEGYALSLSLGTAVTSPLGSWWQTSSYGRRADPFTGAASRHQGVDLAAPLGSAVRSVSDGTASVVAYNDVLGNYVMVRSPLNRTFVYGHMDRVFVSAGARIGQGDRIGTIGMTGKTTGPHLHFEVRENGVPVNPRLYLRGVR
ncbi:MAG: LysM peptidoglycan-binding domain-containing M23 family metallopeptidase [Spirochaetes bacterium]|nr:LysM peptidoglycan-binding domain-containing M23 family metallopeptidase [Spirochaetota bacterium]